MAKQKKNKRKLFDEDGKEVTEPFVPGELYVRAPTLFSAYYKAQEKFDADRRGDFHTVGWVGEQLLVATFDGKSVAVWDVAQKKKLWSVETTRHKNYPGFPKGIMAASCCKQLNDKQIADLVAFLTQKS